MIGQDCATCGAKHDPKADEFDECRRCGDDRPPEECDHCGTTLLPVTRCLEGHPNPLWLCELCRYCRSAVAMASGLGADATVRDVAGMLTVVLAELRDR